MGEEIEFLFALVNHMDSLQEIQENNWRIVTKEQLVHCELVFLSAFPITYGQLALGLA